MSGVFISYRRDDSRGFAGALARELANRIGKDQVFLDTNDIDGGTDFPSVLREAVKAADVVLVIIGKRWVQAQNAQGQRRLDDPSDFVRQEVALALQTRARVIPVLVDGVPMPAAEELPSEMRALTQRHGLALDNGRWDADFAQLLDHVREGLYAVSVDKAGAVKPGKDFFAIPPMTKMVKWFVACGLAMGLLFTAIGAGLGVHQSRFAARSVQAEATVIRLLSERGEESGQLLYRPLLSFVPAGEAAVEFAGGIASAPAQYRIGETVPIQYDPDQPEKAVISTIGEQWMASLGFVGFGLIALCCTLVPLVVRVLRLRRLNRLLTNGKPVMTSFRGVEVNASITLQGRNPYYVVTEWRNPVSKELVRFRSHQVWEDPTEKARNRMITVVVNPNNFCDYVMDLSFLRDGPQVRPRSL